MFYVIYEINYQQNKYDGMVYVQYYNLLEKLVSSINIQLILRYKKLYERYKQEKK